MKTLLCINDLPGGSESFAFSNVILPALQTKLTLLIVRPPGEPPTVGQTMLKQAASLLTISPRHRIIRHGETAAEILAQIQSQQYDLVILDASEQLARDSVITSSVVQRVIAQSDPSVLIVRGHCDKVTHILIATAGQQVSDPTVYAGARFARATGAQVTLLHVTSHYPGMYTGMARLDETLSELLQSATPIARHLNKSAALFDSLGIVADIELRHGLPEDEILSAAETGKFDLLVIGRSAQRILNRLLMAEISQKIIELAPCPILIVSKTLGNILPKTP